MAGWLGTDGEHHGQQHIGLPQGGHAVQAEQVGRVLGRVFEVGVVCVMRIRRREVLEGVRRLHAERELQRTGQQEGL